MWDSVMEGDTVAVASSPGKSKKQLSTIVSSVLNEEKPHCSWCS